MQQKTMSQRNHIVHKPLNGLQAEMENSRERMERGNTYLKNSHSVGIDLFYLFIFAYVCV